MTPGELLAILLPVVVGLALMALASVVIRHGQGQRHNLFFSALYFLSGLKSLGDGLSIADFHRSAALFPPDAFWQILGIFCALGMMPLLLLFAATFPRPLDWLVKRPARAVLFFLPSAIIVAIIVLYSFGAVSGGAFALAASAFNLIFIIVTLLVVVLLLRTRSRSQDRIERSQAGYVLLGFLPAFMAGWIISVTQFAGGEGLIGATQADAVISVILHYVSPTFELLACSIVAFAILKYNLLGVDPKFRLGIKSVVAGLLFILIFLLTQVIENVVLQGQVFSFAGPYGSFILSGVFGMVLFKPIEKVSGNVSERLMPREAATPGSLQAEQVYHAQASYVLRDAKVTDRELAFLRNLRVQLGLSDAAAARIEDDVERLLKVDDARTGSTAPRAPDPPSGSAAVRLAPTPTAAAVPPATPPARRPPAPAAPATKPAAKPARAPAKAPARPARAPGASKAATKGAAKPATAAKGKPPIRRGST